MNRPIDLYTAPTPNGYKVLIAVEEMELPHTLHVLNLRQNESKTPEFLRINPNGKIPALVDHDAGTPVRVFESGAILIHLAEKSGRFLAAGGQARADALGWLMFQMSAVGPIFGQLGFFTLYAKEKNPQAIERFGTEARRILDVMDGQLAQTEYLAGDYSIADMATYAWVKAALERMPLEGEWSHVRSWLERVGARPAVRRAMARI